MGEKIKVSEDNSWMYNAIKNHVPDVVDELHAKFDKQRKDEVEAIAKEERGNEFSVLPHFNQKLLKKGMPPLVMDYLERYEDDNQKDVFILSLLAHVSGILPNYYVVHDGDELTTNLNVFITAPAGSGKSAMSHATRFFQNIDSELSDLSEDIESEIADNDEKNKTMQKTLFIPANTSAAAIIKCLGSNNGCGIICETEADTLGNILTKDWANFDDILRKAFHNEPITMSRAGLNNIVKIPKPALSVILTGTPQQVVKLIPSIENGLFSRFLYYYFKSDDSWRDVFGSTIASTNQISQDLSEIMSAIYFGRLEGQKLSFNWTAEQAEELNEFFAGLLHDSNYIYGANINSVVFRMGLIATRLGAIITYLNYFWGVINGSVEGEETILNADNNVFCLVKHLIEIQLQHTQYVFMQLPQRSDKSFSENGNKQKFFEMLPDCFSRKDAISTFAKRAFIATRTADGFLADFLKSKKLEKNFQGNYYKPDKM